jgi:hypothetical protein
LEPTLDAALANPGTNFMIIDNFVENAPSNLTSVVFDVDEASFPCGFLAAYWALKQNPGAPHAGYVARPGVELAPFHEYDASIPDTIKLEISKIFEGIMDGTIDTGWDQP